MPFNWWVQYKVNCFIVQEANLIFVTSEALAWLYAVFFLSDWIREERKGTNGKYPSTTQRFLAELNASQNTQRGGQTGLSCLFLSLPAASWSHNRGYFSVYWCLTVSPAYMYRQHCSSNTVGKSNKNKALKQTRRLKGKVALNIWRPFSRSFCALVCPFIAFKILSEFLPHSNHTVQCNSETDPCGSGRLGIWMETHHNYVQEDITAHMVINSIEETTRTGNNGSEDWAKFKSIEWWEFSLSMWHLLKS